MKIIKIKWSLGKMWEIHVNWMFALLPLTCPRGDISVTNFVVMFSKLA